MFTVWMVRHSDENTVEACRWKPGLLGELVPDRKLLDSARRLGTTVENLKFMANSEMKGCSWHILADPRYLLGTTALSTLLPVTTNEANDRKGKLARKRVLYDS